MEQVVEAAAPGPTGSNAAHRGVCTVGNLTLAGVAEKPGRDDQQPKRRRDVLAGGGGAAAAASRQPDKYSGIQLYKMAHAPHIPVGDAAINELLCGCGCE